MVNFNPSFWIQFLKFEILAVFTQKLGQISLDLRSTNHKTLIVSWEKFTWKTGFASSSEQLMRIAAAFFLIVVGICERKHVRCDQKSTNNQVPSKRKAHTSYKCKCKRCECERSYDELIKQMSLVSIKGKSASFLFIHNMRRFNTDFLNGVENHCQSND